MPQEYGVACREGAEERNLVKASIMNCKYSRFTGGKITVIDSSEPASSIGETVTGLLSVTVELGRLTLILMELLPIAGWPGGGKSDEVG